MQPCVPVVGEGHELPLARALLEAWSSLVLSETESVRAIPAAAPALRPRSAPAFVSLCVLVEPAFGKLACASMPARRGSRGAASMPQATAVAILLRARPLMLAHASASSAAQQSRSHQSADQPTAAAAAAIAARAPELGPATQQRLGLTPGAELCLQLPEHFDDLPEVIGRRLVYNVAPSRAFVRHVAHAPGRCRAQGRKREYDHLREGAAGEGLELRT